MLGFLFLSIQTLEVSLVLVSADGNHTNADLKTSDSIKPLDFSIIPYTVFPVDLI